MSEFANRKKRVVSNGPVRFRVQRKSVENVPQEDKDGAKKRPQQPENDDTDLPPNENLKKYPDEAYGDTEILAETGCLGMTAHVEVGSDSPASSLEPVTEGRLSSTVFAG